MENYSKFVDAIKTHYTENESVISFYSELIKEIDGKGLLDSNFISQMDSYDKTLQRLSELMMFKYCSVPKTGNIISRDKGPDITFSIEESKVNIELITPIKVTQLKSSVTEVVVTPGPSSNKNKSVEQFIPEMSSLHARITSSLKSKSEIYEGYISNGIVDRNDINIVCINLGFIENNEFIDYPYLKNLFKKQEVIIIDIDEQKHVSHQVDDYTFSVTKETGVTFQTSYFDNEQYPHIDGVWIISCNEKNINNLKKRKHESFERCKNTLYLNGETKYFESIISTLEINKPETDAFTDYIRKHGKLPN
ncbi:hypothetical protein PANTOEA_17850 [Pantoea dispersa]|uniref:hypothetical protein n=1 Tax=Pantoea dispersa TaxID=59814 RepID=UPI0032B35724